ncbi:hypothetical protein [Variovorax sp. PAMC26660]|uniref:hypothetical protein n=1 Tax=Variovorax sp. PAMC26660 TaxID=2762322 RepID=UPI00164CF771|nr:hypothetical protein [Variovorax sp. PAMC26660]QNK65755.1 hypothetical protein H7F35_21360 [Variovorax sp. PAMC26660]
MSTLRKVANALSFAHLAGFAGKARAEGGDDEDEEKKKKDDEAKAKAKAEGDDDDERKKRDDESEDEYSARMKALEEEEKKKDDEAKADDDSDEEMRGDSTAAAARRRERARCAAIFGSSAAGRNPVLAANLAFNTSMTRREAVTMLESTPAPAAASHVSRSARNPQVGAGGDIKTTPQQAAAARWDQNLQAAAKGRR